MSLNHTQKKFLRARAHTLKPVVWIGRQGLTENVLAEIHQALDHHELVKLKIQVGDRELRDQMTTEISAQLTAQLVQKTGNMAVYWRRNPAEPVIQLPGSGE